MTQERSDLAGPALTASQSVSPPADDFDARLARALARTDTLRRRGRVFEVLGNLVRVSGIAPRIAEVCRFEDRDGRVIGQAEVVGFTGEFSVLSPLGRLEALSPETTVVPTGHALQVRVSPGLLGRVLDGYGVPVDGLPPLADGSLLPIDRDPPDPLRRRPVDTAHVTGLRAIDALATCGVGQRLGIFAPAGVGKSTLLGQIAGLGATPGAGPVVVIALVGERGRELADWLTHGPLAAHRDRCVVVVATSDRPAIERVRAAQVATTIAEYFRDGGQEVVLLVDSLTRLARAQREIGLAIGEPPARRGYPPSVFAILPRLLERAGNGEQGRMTAFYTVLVEGDEADDPIAEEARSILDGHLVLTRQLAAANHYPAIDILRSTSRVMDRVVTPTHARLAAQARASLARHEDLELLLRIGEYRPGADAEADRAVDCQPRLTAFLRQGRVDLDPGFKRTLDGLRVALGAAQSTVSPSPIGRVAGQRDGSGKPT